MKKKFGALVATSLLASLTSVLAISSPAQAASCATSGQLCMYKDSNFTTLQAQNPDDMNLSGFGINNNMTSVRNRTSCWWYLFDNASPTGDWRAIAPNSEIANLGTHWGSFWNDRISYVDKRC